MIEGLAGTSFAPSLAVGSIEIRRSFYSATVPDFLSADPRAIVGQLATRHVAVHATAEAEQLRAWERQIELLKVALLALGPAANGWSILLECPLLRLGRRLDTVILAPGMVVVIEFKIGAKTYDAADKAQTERYAQCLRDFHEVSQSLLVVPVLCAETVLALCCQAIGPLVNVLTSALAADSAARSGSARGVDTECTNSGMLSM